jgi:predicted aspartyl protease
MHKDRNYKLTIAILVLLSCGLLLAYRYAVDTKGSPDEGIKQNVLAEFKIAKGGDPIFLPVTFNGEEHQFLLDTGASHTTFDVSFKHQLGKAKTIVKGITSGGPMKLEVFDAPDANLGPFNLKDSNEVTCVDLTMFGFIEGRRISGFVGMNFLSRHVIQIDCDKGRLLFLKPTIAPNPAWGKGLTIKYHPLGVPQIAGVILGDTKVDFWVDAGCNASGTLQSKAFDTILSTKQLKTSETLFATATGVIRQRETRVSTVSIGPFEYENLILHEGYLSALGLPFLSRHTVTLDFPNGTVYFKKGKEFNKVDETDMSGLHLLRVSGNTVVYSVDQDSPAHKAGIRAKDIILKVGNIEAGEYGMCEIRRLLMSGDKKRIEMVIKRGDGAKEVSFLLEKKI